jgi:uncharacterized protein (TIGR04255 family)
MADRPRGLPGYDNPPIDEVAIAVHFERIEALQTERLREFWRSVRAEYPFVEWRPPGDTPLETATSPAQIIQFQIGPTDRQRLWCVSESDDYLIQVQDTTFVQNWRRRETPYTQFESVSERFWKNYHTFCEFLQSKGLALPDLRQVEVTYVDWVQSELAVDALSVLAGTRVQSASGELLDPEELAWVSRYRLPVENDALTSRLYIQAGSGVRPWDPKQRGVQLSLVARTGSLTTLSDDQVRSLIERGRVDLVNTFDRLATPRAKEVWGRR